VHVAACSGASLDERDDVGNTSLLFAAWGGHIKVLQWLIANGAYGNIVLGS